MQAGVGFAAALTYLIMHVGMPDTSHPGTRGIDKEFGGAFKWVWLNPFRCLRYMRSPNLLAMVSQSPQTTVWYPVGDTELTGTVYVRRSSELPLCWLTLVGGFQ